MDDGDIGVLPIVLHLDMTSGRTAQIDNETARIWEGETLIENEAKLAEKKRI